MSLRKAAERALEALEKGIDNTFLVNAKFYEAKIALRQALAIEAFSEVNQEIEQALAQPEQEAFYRLIRLMGTFDLATGHADSWDDLLDSLEFELRDVLGHLRTRREWVGLTEDEFESILEQHNEAFPFAVYQAIEFKLKEKNA